MAQERKEKPELVNSNHSLNIELLGKGLYIMNLSYEYTSKKGLILGIGLGYQDLHVNTYTINYTGSPDDEIVWAKQIYLTIPLYMSLKTHKNKRHHMLFTLAVTPSLSYIYRSEEYSKDLMGSRIRMLDVLPAFTIGYEYDPGPFYLRFNIYAHYIGENDYIPSVMPWIGLSIGRYFKRVKK